MKEIMKKIATLKGVTLNSVDILGFLVDAECYTDKGCFIVNDEQKMTIKLKGKAIDSEDLTISFESK